MKIMQYNIAIDINVRTDPFVETSNGEDWIFDLGMSGGIDALFYAQHGFSVLAVEANGALVKKVRKKLTKQEFPRLTILHAAIYNSTGEKLKFYLITNIIYTTAPLQHSPPTS